MQLFVNSVAIALPLNGDELLITEMSKWPFTAVLMSVFLSNACK